MSISKVESSAVIHYHLLVAASLLVSNSYCLFLFIDNTTFRITSN